MARTMMVSITMLAAAAACGSGTPDAVGDSGATTDEDANDESAGAADDRGGTHDDSSGVVDSTASATTSDATGSDASSDASDAGNASSGTWQQLSTGTGAFGWYFSHAAVERSGAGRIWHTWNGATFLYDPDANVWNEVATENTPGWRENFGSDHDAKNDVIWIGPGAPNPKEWASTLTYSLSGASYTATGTTGCGGNALLAWDATHDRLLCFGGWTFSELATRTTEPAAEWTAVHPRGTAPLITQDTAKGTSWRAGIDARDERLWVIADDQELFRYDPATNEWSALPTNGAKPPNASVFALDEAHDTIVGFVGCDDIPGPCTTPKAETWLLDLGTLAWTLGPTGEASTPPMAPQATYIPLYDRVHARTLLLVAAGNYTDVWTFAFDQ
jgi:hypothetical protein